MSRLHAVLLLILWGGVAMAQDAPPPPAPTPSEAPPPKTPSPDAVDEPKAVSAADKAEARERFKRGLKLLREEAWAPALAEFLRSRELFPTRVATNNAAVSLRKLQRYDEALEMYETLLRDFEVPDAERATAQTEITELRALVGTVDIVGAEPGAAIVISSVDKGEYPPVKPIRVPAGNHVVRLFKEGYEPFEARIDVAGGEIASVKATMVKLTASGRLRVMEQTGKKGITVLVDNVAVGKTPWQGSLGVGDHVVRLVGTGKIGSQPARAVVKAQDLTTLNLLAEPLEAQLRIDPTPPGATVAIDGVEVGNGVWLGRLKEGEHRVLVKADGFLDRTETVRLPAGGRRRLVVELERDDDAPMWRKPPRWAFDAGIGLVIVPSFGGDVADSCGDGCTANPGLGGMVMAQANYELGSGLGFGLEAGYVVASQTVTGRGAALTPVGFSSPTMGTANDDLRMQAFMGGATIGYHLGEQFPVVIRTGAGIMVGELRDERQGSFTGSGGDSYSTFSVVSFPRVTYFYVDPMLRVGWRFLDGFELTGYVQALLLVGLEEPRFDNTLEVAAASDGIGTFSDDVLMGSFVLGVAPGANLRYDFE